MRAYMIAAVAILAMIAVVQATSTDNRVIGAADCDVDCSAQQVEADNGVGTNLPLNPDDYDDDDDQTREP